MVRKLVSICSLLILAACQAIPASPLVPTAAPTLPPPALASTPTQPPPTPTFTISPPTLTPTLGQPTIAPTIETLTASVQVGDYKLKITCEGSGQPTIILENGLGSISFSFARYYNISRTCFYARAGMGSEYIKNTRTTLDQVKDLHVLLTQAGVPGPYVLVGHSIAGYNLPLYTDLFPDEVVGLVCVDCRYPVVKDIFIQKLQAAFSADPALDQGKQLEIIRTYMGEYEQVPFDKLNYKERLDLYTSALQVIKVNNLGSRPFVVLVAPDTLPYPASPNEQVSKMLNESWLEASQKLSQLSTRGRMEIVPGTTHMSILANDAVTKAVQEVIALARTK